MSCRTFIYFLAAFFALSIPSRGVSQSWNMVNGDTVHINACDYDGGTIYDDGGPNGSYSNGFNGWVVIEAAPGVSITLSGDYDIESPSWDYLYVYNGNTSGEVLVNKVGYSGSLNVTATSGRMTIYFHTDGSVTYSGFALNWSASGAGGACASTVTSFAASGVTATSATLSWTSNRDTMMIDYGLGVQEVIGGSTTLTGLNPNTFYTVNLYSAAEAGSRCCVHELTFRTDCGIVGAPMWEKFDDLTADEMPPCWSQGKNFDDESLFPRVTTAAAKSGTQSLMLSSGNNTTSSHFGMVMGPKMDADMSSLRVWVSLRSNYSNAKVEMGVCDTVSSIYNYYGFTPIDTLTISSANTWYDYQTSLAGYSGDGCRIAFRMIQSMQPSGGTVVYIDDLVLENCGVENLSVSYRGREDMTLSWTQIGSPAANLVVAGGGGMATYSGVTSPFHITGLVAGTSYTLTLTPVCGSLSGMSKSITANNLGSDTLPIAYCESFSSAWPETWYRPEVYSSTPYMENMSGDGGYALRLYYNNATNGSTAAMPYTADPSSLTLRFRMVTGNSYGGVIVGVMDYPNEISSFTPVDTVVSPNSSWNTFSVKLDRYSGDGHYIAFRSYSGSGGGFYIAIDDLRVGHCLLTGLTATEVTHNSVT